jgi:hypothetical protein
LIAVSSSHRITDYVASNVTDDSAFTEAKAYISSSFSVHHLIGHDASTAADVSAFTEAKAYVSSFFSTAYDAHFTAYDASTHIASNERWEFRRCLSSL